MTVFLQAIIGILSEAIVSNHDFVRVTVTRTGRNRLDIDAGEKVVLPPPSQAFVFYVSMFCLLYLLLYIVAFTVPNWEKEVNDPIVAKGGDPVQIIFIYFMICVVGTAQNIGYFDAIMQRGVVYVGVISTLVTVIVFCCSNYFFCSLDSEQCGTLTKSISCLVVVFGVLGYNLSEMMTLWKTRCRRKSPSVKRLQWARTQVEQRGILQQQQKSKKTTTIIRLYIQTTKLHKTHFFRFNIKYYTKNITTKFYKMKYFLYDINRSHNLYNSLSALNSKVCTNVYEALRKMMCLLV